MTQVNQPDMTFNILSANTVVQNSAQNILLMAQKTATGTGTGLLEDVQESQIDALGGAGGMAQDAYRAIKTINEITPIDVILATDPTGAAAIGNITFAGTATGPGSLEITIGSERNGKATVTGAKDDLAATVATAMETAFASLTECVCTIAVDGVTAEQVNATYNHDGEEGNNTVIKVTGEIPGITFTITDITGGTGEPSLTGIFNKRYHNIIWPGSWDLTELTTLLDSRWNVNNAVLDGRGFVTVATAKAQHISALEAENSNCLCYQCDSVEGTSEHTGSGIVETQLGRSAQVAALRALRLTDGANLTQFVSTTGGSRDVTGGFWVRSHRG
jgi:phage tail sheath gpL-like